MRGMFKFNTEYTRYLRQMAKRRAAIKAARRTGRTYQSIADQFGLSRERVRQIVQAGK